MTENESISSNDMVQTWAKLKLAEAHESIASGKVEIGEASFELTVADHGSWNVDGEYAEFDVPVLLISAKGFPGNNTYTCESDRYDFNLTTMLDEMLSAVNGTIVPLVEDDDSDY